MNWKKIWFGLIAIGIPVVLLAQSIKWYNDAAIPQKTTLAGNEVMSLQQTGPNAYRWALLSDLKRYVGASNVTIITTNNVVYGSNYYVNNTYVSNYFETNILNNTVVSNYFFDFIYYTNIYQTNVTVNQYVSSDTYVSNFITTNIYNDTYTSNYFTTNLFPTTYVYVTNTIGGAFIANWGGMGTNTALYGGTMFGSQLPNRLLRLDSLGFLDTLPNGTGILTNDGFGGLAWEPLNVLNLTELNVTSNAYFFETNFVNNEYVTNLYVSNIYYVAVRATNVTWAGPTNTLDFSLGTVQSYVTAEPISITNVIGEMAAYQNSTILCISNSSANVITNTLTATGWKLGRFDTLVCTNAGVIQIWLQNIGGMKTVAVREYP